MSATPTGADAMKEAATWLAVHDAGQWHDYRIHANAAAAIIRKLVEAQPAAVAGHRAFALFRQREDENDGREFFFCAMWHADTAPSEGERIVPGYFVPDHAPAAPSVGEPQGAQLVSITVGGSTHTRTAEEWLALARADLASPAAPAGVPTDFMVALAFHEAYERLAPSFGYTTRPETRAFDSNSANGKLMIAVIGEIRALLKAGSVHPSAAGAGNVRKALVLGLQHAQWSKDRSRDPIEQRLNEQDVATITAALALLPP